MATWQAYRVIGHHNSFAEEWFSFHAKNSMSALNKFRKHLHKESIGLDVPLGYGEHDRFIKLLDKEDIQAEDLHNEYFED